jgi:tRNA(adenine34) deaminase
VSPVTVSATDTTFMTAALGLAREALAAGEFPVGCVIADGRRVIARGRRTGTAAGMANEIDHAELNTLRHLYENKPDIDRSMLTVYCTMEPCLMCFSAIMLSGIGRLVYAYEDVMGGGTGCDRTGLSPLFRDAGLTVVPGVLRADSLALFQRFFADADNSYWADSLLSQYTLDQPLAP